ncbi:MAG TPA: hypothetical protein VFM69_07585 [Pricia sp.]|nr:hypothetical protein [Pricia sp.]
MAKSTLLLEFTDPLVSVSTSVSVNIKMGSAGNTFPFLRAAPQRTRKGEFEILDTPPTNVQHVFSFVSAWNKDYKDIGGFNNMMASYSDEGGKHYAKIVLDDENWTFNSVTVNNVTADEIIATFTNADAPIAKKYDHALTGADCTDADYSIEISGGTAPYSIKGLPDGTKTGVGASSTFILRRGVPATVRVEDSIGALIQSKSVTPPKKLKASDFTISVVPENSWNTANVDPNVVLGAELLPIEYSLNGVDYTETGSFSDLDFEQTYTMYIKDAFGCVVQKTFVTLEDFGGDLEQQYLRYFQASNANNLILTEYKQFSRSVKKNPFNTTSCRELVGIAYTYIHEFDPLDTITQQFKSSYSFHKITLVDGDYNNIDIVPVEQHQNLNQKEKVDAKLFMNTSGKMGLYFDGGANYVPDTSTVDGDTPTSPYNANNIPSWAMAGQNVLIDGVGFKQVVRIGTDGQRGYYLEFSDTYSSVVDSEVKVQANFNRQDYNLYEFDFPMSDVSGLSRIIIEMGFNGAVERTFVSEPIKQTEDGEGTLLIEWSDPENKAGMVYQTQITNFARLYGKFVHKTVRSSELTDADNGAVSLDQRGYIAADLEMWVSGFGMENKLAIASGMESFKINGIEYETETWESELFSDSNIYRIKALLRMGINQFEVTGDEIVLNPPSTPITEKPGVPLTVPGFLAINDGGLILNGSGGFIVVDS